MQKADFYNERVCTQNNSQVNQYQQRRVLIVSVATINRQTNEINMIAQRIATHKRQTSTTNCVCSQTEWLKQLQQFGALHDRQGT